MQIEILSNYIGLEGHVRKGQRLNVTPERAQYLLGLGYARLVPAAPVQTSAPPAPVLAPSVPPIIRRPVGWPIDRFSVVGRAWEGRTVVCIGGGPSLTDAQIALIHDARRADRIRVIAVNDAYRLAPWADIVYFADRRWYGWHREALADFAGVKVSIEDNTDAVGLPDVHVLKNDSGGPQGGHGPGGLCERPNALRTGQNSGYQAINLAVHAGARRIVLVGYDCKAAGRKMHWFGDHPVATPKAVFGVMLHNFPTLVEPLKRLGVSVINCTPGSALKAFPADDLARVLSAEEAAALPA